VEKRENQVQVMTDKASKSAVSTEKPKRLSRFLIKSAIVFAAVAAVGAVSQLPSRRQDAPATDPPPVKVAVMTVVAVPELPDTIDLPAVVEPNRIVTVSAEADGRIEWIGPKEGDFVRAGDPLIRLNTDLLLAQFQRAEAQAKFSQTEFDRIKGLADKGAAPARDLDSAAAQLAMNTAQLEECRVRLARAQIAAPMTGVLNELLVEVGEYVTMMPLTTLARIVDIDTVKVAVEVPERDVSFFSVGQQAEVLVDSRGQPLTLTGTITYLSQLANERTRSTRLEIMLPNRERLLHSGQIVHVRLTRQVLKDAIMIPLFAVIPMEDGKAVYVVKSAQAERRRVDLGIIKDDRIQIRSGLVPGDQLIVAGHRFVAPGQKVDIVPGSK
jgi:membrane fusion protein (multidrug efflux system)